MRKLFNVICTSLIVAMIMLMTNFSCLVAKDLTDQEKKAFITREEFEQWRDSFIASLSELDTISTNKIYDNMEFYDMQFKFTEAFKTEEYWDESTGKNTPYLDELIMEEKAKRGLL